MKLDVLSLRLCHRQCGYKLSTVGPRMDLHNLDILSLAFLLATTVVRGDLSLPHPGSAGDMISLRSARGPSQSPHN
jgi:hypothetical protein